jgi:predicted MFS family arabinose efflux permease
MTAPGDGPPRSRLGLLRDGAVGPLITGRILSTLAVWFTNVAASILVYDLTRSASAVALITTAQFAPQLLLVPLTGARADRGDRALQMLLGTVVTASGSVLLVSWALTVGMTRPSDAIVVGAAAALVGTGFAIGGPASQALIPSLVRRSELADALALTSLPIMIARAAGPAVGAVMYVRAGAVVTFATSLALHLVLATILVAIRRRLTVGRDEPADDLRIRAALRYILDHPRAGLALVGLAMIGVGVDPVVTLGPSLADLLGDPTELVGHLASAFGVGTALGYAALSRTRTGVGLDRLGALGLRIMAAGLLLAAGAAWAGTSAVAVALLGLGVAGVGMPLSLNAYTTIVQTGLPDGLRGRVMALWSMAFIGSRPVAATLNGAVADAAGVRVALVTAATLILIGAAAAGSRRLAAARPEGDAPDAGPRDAAP